MLNSMSDNRIIKLLKDSVAIERMTVVKIIGFLKEVQRRRLFCDYGYPSLHAFCVGELGYSDGETSRKIRTIKLVNLLSQAEKMIEAGTLNITGASSLFTHMRKDECSIFKGGGLIG